MERSESILARRSRRQGGFSLIGMLCTLLVLGVSGILALRAGPSVVEFWAVRKAVLAAHAVAATPDELRSTFDKLAAAGFIDSIEGKDLKIDGKGDAMQVSFAYQKKIPLIGPASLLIDYRGSTANEGSEKAAH